jgi:hypothetical protein
MSPKSKESFLDPSTPQDRRSVEHCNSKKPTGLEADFFPQKLRVTHR